MIIKEATRKIISKESDVYRDSFTEEGSGVDCRLYILSSPLNNCQGNQASRAVLLYKSPCLYRARLQLFRGGRSSCYLVYTTLVYLIAGLGSCSYYLLIGLGRNIPLSIFVGIGLIYFLFRPVQLLCLFFLYIRENKRPSLHFVQSIRKYFPPIYLIYVNYFITLQV